MGKLEICIIKDISNHRSDRQVCIRNIHQYHEFEDIMSECGFRRIGSVWGFYKHNEYTMFYINVSNKTYEWCKEEYDKKTNPGISFDNWKQIQKQNSIIYAYVVYFDRKKFWFKVVKTRMLIQNSLQGTEILCPIKFGGYETTIKNEFYIYDEVDFFLASYTYDENHTERVKMKIIEHAIKTCTENIKCFEKAVINENKKLHNLVDTRTILKTIR